MSKKKEDYVNDLVSIAFKMDEKANRQHERTERFRKMASLARQGKKDTQEFKQLEMELNHPVAFDFDDADYQDSDTIYVTFKPNQIKSIENDGTWDIGDDNIFS
jgi:hypothetical protein